MHSCFSFGDRTTLDFGMRVERYPRQLVPGRKMKTFPIAGRNGDLHALEDAWENYIQPSEVYFHDDIESAPEMAHAIAAWLMGGAGYQKLLDTYDPGHYRMALFKGPMDIENIMNRYGRCTIQFDCAPQSFLVGGDTPLVFEGAGSLHNVTSFDALPVITVYGDAPGTVTVGSTTVEIKEISDPIILDCEMMQAYSKPGEGAPVNRNGSVHALPFPVLSPGANAVSFSGGISKLEIVPRWWTL